MLSEDVRTESPEIAILAASVRELRKRRNLTQEEVARRARISTTTLSNLENERIRVHRATKEKLAAALGVTVEELDSGELAREVATTATTLEQREAIHRVLTLSPDDVQDILKALRSRGSKR